MSSFHRRIASRLRFRDYLRRYRSASNGVTQAQTGPKAVKHRSLARLYRELYQILAGYRGTLALALAGLSIATLMKLIPPAATKAVIDYVVLARPLPQNLSSSLPFAIPESPKLRLFGLVGLVLLVSILGKFFGLTSRWQATRATKRVQVAIRRRVYEHAMRLPLHRVYELKSGGASSLLREDAGGVGELIFSMLYNPFQAVIQFLGGVIVLAWVDWRLLLGALLLVPGVYYSDLLWNRRIRPLFRDIRKERQDVDSQTTEVFGGMRVVLRLRPPEERISTIHGRKPLHGQARAPRLVALPLDRAALGVPPAHRLRRPPPLRRLAGHRRPALPWRPHHVPRLPGHAPGADGRAGHQRDSAPEQSLGLRPRARPPRRTAEMADCPGTRSISKPAVSGRITLRDVGFIYPGTTRQVLRNINLDVHSGETIALVGRSGSGKTTLCNLIARFYDPSSGTIALDGVNLRELQVESYRRLLGIVEQDVFLFDGTVAENIAYGHRWATLTRIEQAAHAANAAEFIERLSNRYDTVVGERGVRLSGGQRQRLAIARAVLADPRIFILDEATSNLDSESERLIQQSLEQLLRGRTSFVIAHRLSTIRHADRILVMDDGAIVEAGSHAELMAGSGLYRDMVDLQRIEQGQGASP